MQILVLLSMFLALSEGYTLVNYFARRECKSGTTAQCSDIPQRVCCASKQRFRSTKFTGITTGDICIVWNGPKCSTVNDAKSNQRCVSQTQSGTNAKLGGSSVRRQASRLRRDEEECESSVEIDQVNMDGYSYKVNYHVPQNITDEIFFHANEDTPRHELPPYIQELGVMTQYDSEGTPIDIATL